METGYYVPKDEYIQMQRMSKIGSDTLQNKLTVMCEHYEKGGDLCPGCPFADMNGGCECDTSNAEHQDYILEWGEQ